MRRLGNPARDTFNVPYDLFPPLLIKLLITFGCYRHQGDIPQVLSAVRAPENPRRGTPLRPRQSFRLSHSCSTRLQHLYVTADRPLSETTLLSAVSSSAGISEYAF